MIDMSMEVVPLVAVYLILESEAVAALDNKLKHAALSHARDLVWPLLTPTERSVLVSRSQPVFPR